MLICPHSYLSVDHAVFLKIPWYCSGEISERKRVFFMLVPTVLKPETWTNRR